MGMHVSNMARKNAEQVRKEQKLPRDGRGARVNLARVEQLFRAALAPDVPSFDVNCVQRVDFDEWSYTEGLGLFLGCTQSTEINARLIMEASEWQGDLVDDHVKFVRDDLLDKWLLKENTEADGSKVFFPPGNNLGWIINTDNVLRAFCTDKSWRLKPHPITSDADVREARLAFGAPRIFARNSSGMQLLRKCETVGYTTASELGLVGMILGKQTVDFTKYEFEGRGRYHSLYLAIRQSSVPAAIIFNRLVNCPWSGIVPLTIAGELATERFKVYKEKTLELKSRYAPLTRQMPPMVAQAKPGLE